MKKFLKIGWGILALVVSFLGISSGDVLANKTLKVGVTAGPHIQILTHLKERALKEGVTLEIVEFNDFILPNIALAEKEIEANIYQHAPFLEDQKKSRGFQFQSLGKTILLPMGVYSVRHTTLEALPRAGKIAIPNDPTNGGRALLLLQSLGLVTLKEGVGAEAMVTDIRKNPHHLKIVEVEAPQLPRSLEDVDLAVINMDWVLVAGLDPAQALAQESCEASPYTNLIVVRDGEGSTPALKLLQKLYHSDETKAFIENTFKGSILVGW